LPAGRDCTSVRATGPAGAIVEKTAPVPAVFAEMGADEIVVHWQLLASPAACRPAGLLVTANSVDRPDNMALAPANGSVIPITGADGTVRLKLPVLDLPPYEARVSVLTARGARSAVTTVPVAGSGRGCRNSASRCVAAAQRKAIRCERGTLPRGQCPGRFYGTARPPAIRPLPGMTRPRLERSVRDAVARATYAGTTIGSVSCRPAWSCTVAWRGSDAHPVRVIYRLGAAGPRGCWFAARVRILDRVTDQSVRSAVDPRPDGSAGLSGCTSSR
jgi:hypothetical protein